MRLPKLFHSSLPMRPAMSRVQSFMSMVAWRKSECCNMLYVVFEKYGF